MNKKFLEHFFGVKITQRRSGILRRSRFVIRKRTLERVLKKSLVQKEHYLVHKAAALILVTERISHFNTQYNLNFKNISIRNQTTRWGSCSSKGNLSFNYLIVRLPQHLADYIVVHELCHLGEFNHSKKFWELVSRADPDYKKHQIELKKIRIGELIK